MGSEQAFHSGSASSGNDDDWVECARSAMSVVTGSLAKAAFGEAMVGIEQCRAELDALESLKLAERSEAGHSDRSNQKVITGSGGVSKGEAKRRTRRAKAVGTNPTLAKKLSNGDLSTEQVDNIAEASEKTDGAAAGDETLIKEIGEANPDQGKAIVRKYIEENQDPNDRDTRYKRQRRYRRVFKTRTSNGMARLVVEGDNESVDSALRKIKRGADALYRADGGRDVPGHKHRRTYDQRMFDAAMGCLNNDDADASEASANSDGSGSANGTSPRNNAGSPQGTSEKAKSPTGSRSSKRKPTRPKPPRPPRNRPGERPTTILRIDLDHHATANNLDSGLVQSWKTELVGTGLIPTTLAEHFGCISDIAIQFTDAKGVILQQGRARRSVTVEQWIALVTRDEGCVQCGAHHTQCEAHHLIPWTSRLKGRTNVDEMALMCIDCHHQLHELNQTLYQNSTGHWKTRAATPDETPATGPRRSKWPGATSASNRTSNRRIADSRNPTGANTRTRIKQGQRAP